MVRFAVMAVVVLALTACTLGVAIGWTFAGIWLHRVAPPPAPWCERRG